MKQEAQICCKPSQVFNLYLFPQKFLLVIQALICICLLTGCGSSNSDGGGYSIGRQEIVVKDSNRKEIFGNTAGSDRELAVYVWYPATPDPSATKGPWLPDSTAELYAAATGFNVDSLRAVPTESYINAPVRKSLTPYPVLLLSHGNGASPLIYSTLAEELASRGYVVFGVSHTYNDPLSVFPDGRVFLADSNADAESIAASLTDSSNFKDRINVWNHSCDLSQYFVKDLSSVIDNLVRMNNNDPQFTGLLNINQIGAFGHSFGGAHSFGVSRNDPRVKAAADLDGTIFNRNFKLGTDKPFMVISADLKNNTNEITAQLNSLGFSKNEIQEIVSQSLSQREAFEASPNSYFITMKKILHFNFTDFGVLEHLDFPQDQISKESSPRRVLNNIIDYLDAFFIEAFQGKGSKQLDSTGPNEEVTIERNGE